MPLTFGSLFAGIGGFDLGFHRAGMACRWHVEKDPDCLRVLAHHWPGVPKLDDVCKAGKHNLEPVDVICFGSPCQDLSVAGKRGGLGGERSGLFHEAARILRELRPAVAVWENVPGAFSSESGRDFRTVLLVLRECGAVDIAWRTLDAQYFGVAQRRRRLFVVADFRAERAGQILFESPCGCGHPSARGQAAEGVAATIRSRSHGPGVNPPGRGGEDDQNLVFQANGAGSFRAGAPTLSAGDDNNSNQVVAFNWQAGGNQTTLGMSEELTGSLQTDATPAVAFGVFSHNGAAKKDHAKQTDVANTVDQSGGYSPGQGGTVVAFNIIGLGQQGKNHAYEADITGTIQHKGNSASGNEAGTVIAFDKYNQADTGDVAHALGSGSKKHNNAHTPHVAGMTVRRLTPTECERLQGFPDDWTALPKMSDSPRYRMLGNAVCVAVAQWIGRRIAEAAKE